MPGNNQATGLLQGSVRSVWGNRNPNRTREWGDGAKAMRTMQLPSILPTRDKAWPGCRSSTLGMARQALGMAVLPAPLWL